MSQDLLASKVVVVEEEPKVRGIASAPTSVAGAVGIAGQGPFDQATLCTSFDEYQATFGDFTLDSDLALAAKGFFENGGNQLWVSRVSQAEGPKATAVLETTTYPDAQPAMVTSTLSPPFSVTNGAQLTIVNFPGLYAYSRTLTFQGAPGTVQGTQTEPFALSNGQTLTVTVDGGPPQTVTFATVQFENIAQASADEVAFAISSALTGAMATTSDGSVVITSFVYGTSSLIEVASGVAATTLGMAGASVPGSGNVENLDLVTVAEMQAILGVDVEFSIDEVSTPQDAVVIKSNYPGDASYIQVSGSATEAMGLDEDGHSGVSGTPLTLPAISFEARVGGLGGNQIELFPGSPSGYLSTWFNLSISTDGGVTGESFTDLSRDPDAPRFVETIINDPVTGSQLVRATNLSNSPWARPDFTPVTLAGGVDGGITDESFVGDEASKKGLHALDAVQDLSLLLVPGRATPSVHAAMLAYCEEYRYGTVFAILDPPAGMSAADMVDYVSTTASLENTSEFGAIYWPRVKIGNPKASVFGYADQIVVPPSGIIAGVCARTDGSRPGGVYGSPAGIETGRLFGVLGFETDETFEESKRDLVYPHRINPLTSETGLPRYIDGSRTLKGDGNFPSIGARRGVIFIERSLKKGLSFVRHANNTPELRAQVRRTITAFLTTQMNNGAFRSLEPAKAFFVDVSDRLNPPSVVKAGKLIARIGLATNQALEFVVLQISQDTRELDAELEAAG